MIKFVLGEKVKLATLVQGDLKAPFTIVTSPRGRGGCYSFPGLLHFTLDAYLIMLSVKQGSIKYHFWSLWYDSIEPRSPGPLANTLLAHWLSGRMFANGPGDRGSIFGRAIPKTQKVVLDTSLFNTQHYKVGIKSKVERSKERSTPSPIPRSSSYWKGNFWVILDYGRQLYFTCLRYILSSQDVQLLKKRKTFMSYLIKKAKTKGTSKRANSIIFA